MLLQACRNKDMPMLPASEVDLRDSTNDPLSAPEPPKKQDLSGKFVIVTYDELPYVGQVLQVVGEEVQVTSMRQSGENNLFVWPQVPDIIYYYKKVLH